MINRWSTQLPASLFQRHKSKSFRVPLHYCSGLTIINVRATVQRCERPPRVKVSARSLGRVFASACLLVDYKRKIFDLHPGSVLKHDRAYKVTVNKRAWSSRVPTDALLLQRLQCDRLLVGAHYKSCPIPSPDMTSGTKRV